MTNPSDATVYVQGNLDVVGDILCGGLVIGNTLAAPIFGSVAEASAATIGADDLRLTTAYFDPVPSVAATLVGGASYRRADLSELVAYPAASKFRSADRFLPNGDWNATSGGYWLLDSQPATPHMLGALGNDAQDDSDAIEALHLYILARGGGAALIPKGVFRSQKAYYIPSNSTLEFVGWFKAIARPTDNFDTLLLPRVGASQFVVYNPQIDLNLVASMNGFILRTGSHEGAIYGGIIKNGLHDKLGTHGGRGFNVESDATGFSGRNIVVDGVHILACYMGFGFRGGDLVAKNNIIINNITIESCQTGFWIVGNTAGYPHTAEEMQGIISNITCYNVGRNTTYTGQDGVFVSDRGCNIIMSNCICHNDAGYPAIDSMWHGNGAKLTGDFRFYGAATNIYDLGPFKESDAGPPFEFTVSNCDLTATCYDAVTDIIKTAAVGAGYVTNTTLRATAANVTSGVAVTAGYQTQGGLTVAFTDQTTASVARGAANLVGSYTFAVGSGRNFFAGDVASVGFVPSLTLRDASATAKDYRWTADTSIVALLTDAVADSGLFDRTVVIYNDATGAGSLLAQGVVKINWAPGGVAFNAGTIGQPTVTGSRGGNAALESLLTGLATIGLIIDGSVP